MGDHDPPAAPDPAHFRQVLGHFPTGVTVITSTAADGARVGLAVGSFFSVSLEPPLVGFCAGHSSASWPKIREAGKFCVNVLAAEQESISRVFASKAPDKFDGLGFTAAPFSGAPILNGVLAWVDCELEAVHGAGDHDIVVGWVHQLAVAGEDGPLVFYRGGYHDLGL